MSYPPYTINSRILSLTAEIQETIGKLSQDDLAKSPLILRKKNKIKTIKNSLAIEGNSLSLEQVSALIEGKRIIGPIQQIREVQNAIFVYENIGKINPFSEKDFLNAHKKLMQNLTEKPGIYRTGQVGILKGGAVSKIAPPFKRVPELMQNLFGYLKSNEHLLLKACVFHYELEFIHPFFDGNGRMGRLWQQLLLIKHTPLFEYLSVESLICEKQKQYYAALEKSDLSGEATTFIEFSLEIILQALVEFTKLYRPTKLNFKGRLTKAKDVFKNNLFSRKDYLGVFTQVSTATASRDLQSGVEDKLLTLTGNKATAKYRFKS